MHPYIDDLIKLHFLQIVFLLFCLASVRCAPQIVIGQSVIDSLRADTEQKLSVATVESLPDTTIGEEKPSVDPETVTPAAPSSLKADDREVAPEEVLQGSNIQDSAPGSQTGEDQETEILVTEHISKTSIIDEKSEQTELSIDTESVSTPTKETKSSTDQQNQEQEEVSSLTDGNSKTDDEFVIEDVGNDLPTSTDSESLAITTILPDGSSASLQDQDQTSSSTQDTPNEVEQIGEQLDEVSEDSSVTVTEEAVAESITPVFIPVDDLAVFVEGEEPSSGSPSLSPLGSIGSEDEEVDTTQSESTVSSPETPSSTEANPASADANVVTQASTLKEVLDKETVPSIKEEQEAIAEKETSSLGKSFSSAAAVSPSIELDQSASVIAPEVGQSLSSDSDVAASVDIESSAPLSLFFPTKIETSTEPALANSQPASPEPSLSPAIVPILMDERDPIVGNTYGFR